MDKASYFIAACKAERYRDLPWVISAFAMIREGPDDWRADPYPYRIVLDQVGYSFVSPSNPNELVRITDAVANAPLYSAREPLALTAGDLPNLGQDIQSTYGNCLFNWIALVYPFGNKIAYVDPTKAVDMKPIYKQILARFSNDVILEHNVQDESLEKPDRIYVREYLKFTEGMFFFTGMTQLFVWAGSKRILTPPPGIVEFRANLLRENATTLHETSTIAKIDDALIAFDAEYVKGDPSESFLDKKARVTVRKKLFLTGGAEVSLSENSTAATLIPTSLSEGLDVEKWPAYMDGLRAGSYFRGAETMLGGVSAKELLRSTSNINVIAGDCGARLGSPTTVGPGNLEKLSNFSFVDLQGRTTLFRDAAHVGEYMGKRLMVRNPMYCQAQHPDYCSVCVGKRLAATPDGVSVEVMAYGSTFLKMSLKKMHANVLSLAKMDFRLAIT